MNSWTRSFGRTVNSLLCVGIVCLAFKLWGTEATPSAAEKTWNELLAAMEGFDESQLPNLEKKEFDSFLKEYAEKAGTLADRFKDYQAQFPTSTNVSAAWRNRMDLLDVAAHGSALRRAELEKAEQECLADPKLSQSQRSRIHKMQIGQISDLAGRERLVRKLKVDGEESTDFFCRQMLDLAEFAEYSQSCEIVDDILKLTEGPLTWEDFHAAGNTSTNERTFQVWCSGAKANREMHHRRALELKKQLDRIGHPLQLQFTALDGTKIDLEHYRGKVVLLDFWATWCPPCVGGIPEVKAVWQKLHKDGFEVIGMSYDDERQTLEKFLKKNELPWPQFFDPAGKGAPLIQTLGQPGPPAYWLIDRQGLVSDLNTHYNLEKKVKQLLDANPKPVSAK